MKKGYYAVGVCWDANEGVFPKTAYYDGEQWDIGDPILYVQGPFPGRAYAENYLIAYVPELYPARYVFLEGKINA